MTRRSWPAIGAAALMSATALPFFSLPAAAAEGRDIVEGWKAWAAGLKVEGLDFEIAAVEEAEGGSVTVMKGLELSFSREIEVPSDTDGRPPQTFRLSFSTEVPEIRFTDLTRTSEGYAAASYVVPIVTLKGSVNVSGEDVSISQVFHDYTAMQPRWPELPDIAEDSDRPFSRFQPLWTAGISASSESERIERIEADFVYPEGRQQTTVGAMEMTGNSDGGSARLVVGASEGEVTMMVGSLQPSPDGTMPPPSSQVMTFKQGPQEFIGYSLRPLYRALFEGGPGLGKPPEAMASSGRTGAIELIGPELGYTIGAQVIEDVRMGVPEVNVAREIDRLILAAQAGSVDPIDIVDLGLTVYREISIGKLKTEGFSIDTPVFTTKIGEMVLERLSKDGMGVFSIGAIEARGEDGSNDIGTFKLGRFAIRDVVFPTKDAIMALARLESDPLGGGQPIEPSTRQILDVVPMVGGVELEGLAVDSDTTGPIALDRFALTLGGFIPPVPTETQIELSRLSFPTALVTDPDAKAFL